LARGGYASPPDHPKRKGTNKLRNKSLCKKANQGGFNSNERFLLPIISRKRRENGRHHCSKGGPPQHIVAAGFLSQ